MSNNQALVNALRGNLTEINKMINSYTVAAENMGVSVYELCDPNGNRVLAPMLLAKAQCLNGIAQLK